jgi:biopolymer transport protein ExbD
MPEPASDPSGTTMSDVAWNLMLTILAACVSLVPASQAVLQNVEMQLAHSSRSAPAETEKDTIRLTIDSEGIVTLEERRLGPIADAAAILPAELRELIQSRPNSVQVWVVPDRRIGWEDVVRIHDAVRSVTGEVSFIAETPEVQK